MMRGLISEYRKTRHLYIFVIAVGITVLGLCWSLNMEVDDVIRKYGWMMNLYQFPLVNAIILPLLVMVTASMLCSAEHKGAMQKELCCLESRSNLYDAKLLYGLGMVVFCTAAMVFAQVAYGFANGYQGTFPAELYAKYLLFTLAPTVVIYCFQYGLSMGFKNQAVAFTIGILGEFIGIFAMFLPQIPMLRGSFLWGYYGGLQMVGMYGWTRETRYENVYFLVEPANWAAFAVLLLAGAACYAAGKYYFCRKDL